MYAWYNAFICCHVLLIKLFSVLVSIQMCCFSSTCGNSNEKCFSNLQQCKWVAFEHPCRNPKYYFPLHQILSRLHEKTHGNDILIAACGKWCIDLDHISIRSKIKTYQASIDLEEKEWELWSICELLINILMMNNFISIGCKEYSIFTKPRFWVTFLCFVFTLMINRL